jgi:hypothetical protein
MEEGWGEYKENGGGKIFFVINIKFNQSIYLDEKFFFIVYGI